MLQSATSAAKTVEVAPAAVGAGLASRPRAASSAPRGEFGSADKAVRPPEAWIEDIRRLRREGREAEAQTQLAAFRLAYPDYRLPEDLRAP
jgi:hypothetical protein